MSPSPQIHLRRRSSTPPPQDTAPTSGRPQKGWRPPRCGWNRWNGKAVLSVSLRDSVPTRHRETCTQRLTAHARAVARRTAIPGTRHPRPSTLTANQEPECVRGGMRREEGKRWVRAAGWCAHGTEATSRVRSLRQQQLLGCRGRCGWLDAGEGSPLPGEAPESRSQPWPAEKANGCGGDSSPRASRQWESWDEGCRPRRSDRPHRSLQAWTRTRIRTRTFACRLAFYNIHASRRTQKENKRRTDTVRSSRQWRERV